MLIAVLHPDMVAHIVPVTTDQVRLPVPNIMVSWYASKAIVRTCALRRESWSIATDTVSIMQNTNYFLKPESDLEVTFQQLGALINYEYQGR